MAIYPMDSVIQPYEQPRPGLVRKNRNTNSLHSQSKVYLNEKKKKARVNTQTWQTNSIIKRITSLQLPKTQKLPSFLLLRYFFLGFSSEISL